MVVPGLLQTADYAREIFRNGPIELDPASAVLDRTRGYDTIRMRPCHSVCVGVRL